MKPLLVCAIVALLACGCSSTTQKQTKISTVKVDTVRLYGASPYADYSGRVRAAEDLNLSFRVSGTLLETPHKDGEFVKMGSLLAKIDPRDYQLQLSATEAEYNQIKADAERVIELYNRNSISQSDYEKALYGLQQIEAKYSAHKNALQDTELLAPFDGYVQKYNYSSGETLAAGYPVVSFYSNDNVEVEINIPLDEYEKRSRFNSFECMVGSESVPMTLVSISPKANLNQLYRALFRVDSGSERPAAGTITSVRIGYEMESSSDLVVPITALFNIDGNSYVWVVKEGVISRVAVYATDVYTDGFVRIEGNITIGDLVVSGGVRSLSDGQSVRPLSGKSQTNVGWLL